MTTIEEVPSATPASSDGGATTSQPEAVVFVSSSGTDASSSIFVTEPSYVVPVSDGGTDGIATMIDDQEAGPIDEGAVRAGGSWAGVAADLQVIMSGLGGERLRAMPAESTGSLVSPDHPALRAYREHSLPED